MSQDSKVNLIMLPSSDWDQLLEGIGEIKEAIKGKAKEDCETEWLDSKSARLLLGVSAKTWQTMRDRRQIEFSQIGRKIYVRRAVINEYLKQHAVSKSVEG